MHTPGPWRVIDSTYDNGSRDIRGPLHRDGSSEYIATLSGCDETEANGSLIAAAPKLLKSLEALVEQFHAYENGWMGEGIWRVRIGLPSDLQAAELAIREAKRGDFK